ncbi:uncharacterized protein LOC117345432 [Pecten maximus]|uniref:uncharacterized protein LOC117345432 n=1 Tax=Pecten maximus TaxID=6579 RepID=UPI0014581C81|nr:uncharacterized protein LOC117345432 [Pecten maximus]
MESERSMDVPENPLTPGYYYSCILGGRQRKCAPAGDSPWMELGGTKPPTKGENAQVVKQRQNCNRYFTFRNSDSHVERHKVQGEITPLSNQLGQQHRDFISARLQTQIQLGASTRTQKLLPTGTI